MGVGAAFQYHGQIVIVELSYRFFGGRRLPVILQTESAECGLACLAMMASYHGHEIDLSTLRQRFSISLKGATLKDLIALSHALGLHPRPLKLDLDHLRDLKLPCILHWDMTHFVVLRSVVAKHATIHDPAIGERRLPLRQFADHFTGVALELAPGSDFRLVKETRKYRLRDLMGRVTGLYRGLGQLLLLGIALQVCLLVAPFYMQWIVDEALVAADRDLISVLGIGFLLLVVIQTAMSATRAWVGTVLTTQLNYQWLSNAFAHVLRLPIPFFEKRHLGDIVSRFDSIRTIQQGLTTQFVEAVIDGLLAIATGILMMLYSPSLTALATLAVLLYALLRWAMFRPLRDATAEKIIHGARQQTDFLESARGIQSIRLFGREAVRLVGWTNRLASQFNAELRMARITVSYQAANTLLFGIERILIIWLSALAVIDGRFSVGMLFAFMAYKQQFSERLAALIDRLYELRMLGLHGERVADIVLTESEPATETMPETGEVPTPPEIQLRNVSFRYADGEPWVLRDLNLKVPAGQEIAIAGVSGCGKTTLVKLMLGLLQPVEGEILIGGIPLSHFGVGRLRRLCGAVMQEDQLFSGSVADNICFFDPAPDMAKIIACAKTAALEGEVNAMPMGFNTLIGDIGTGLSGGQRQRLLLARALYRDPVVLVLDEATSHLDVWNEQIIGAALSNLSATRIVVAHRPETIAMAQRVVVLGQGRIVRDMKQPQQTSQVTMDEAPSAS